MRKTMLPCAALFALTACDGGRPALPVLYYEAPPVTIVAARPRGPGAPRLRELARRAPRPTPLPRAGRPGS